jgi:nucleoside 2-deoxyribosyltransferase
MVSSTSAVIRVDRVEHSENINDKIIADIRRAEFVVADFSFHPAGVYFEAGFALGLHRLVVWTCRQDEFKTDKVHFDTRPYNHIVWETEADLREKLTARVRALVPNAKCLSVLMIAHIYARKGTVEGGGRS